MADLHSVLKDALVLSDRDRAALANELLASLDQISEEESERLWAEEAQRRLQGFREGKTQAIPAAEVAQKAAKLFR